MGTRNVTVDQAANLAQRRKRGLLFVEMDCPSGFVRVTNAAYNIEWDSKTWIGVGKLGIVRAVRESLGIEANPLQFGLSGVDPALIQQIDQEDLQGRPARLWFATIGPTGIANAPTLLSFCLMDTMAIQDGSTATITVTAESPFAGWSRPNPRRFSNADQQAEFPGDLFFEHIAELASGREIKFGRT